MNTQVTRERVCARDRPRQYSMDRRIRIIGILNGIMNRSSYRVMDATSEPSVRRYVGALVRNAHDRYARHGHVLSETGVALFGNVENPTVHLLKEQKKRYKTHVQRYSVGVCSTQDVLHQTGVGGSCTLTNHSRSVICCT